MDDIYELDELRALAPPPQVRPLSPERLALRKAIVMREIVRSLDAGAPPPPAPTSRRGHPTRRRRRTPILIAAALVLMTGTAVAWAVVDSSARNTVSVQCEIQGVDTVIPS